MSTSRSYWPPSVVTTAQVKYVLGEFEALKEWVKTYDRSVKVGAITKSPRPTISAEAVMFLAKKDPQTLVAADIETIITKVETALQSSPQIHISLPSLPQNEIRLDLAGWFRNNISPKVLLSFSADSTLGGGMALRTRNHLYNFSLRRLLWEQRSLIPGLLRDAK